MRAFWQPTHVLHTTLGLLIWCLWFVVLYGGLSVGCALAPPPPVAGALTWLNGGLLALTLTATALLLGLAWRCLIAGQRSRPGSQDRAMARISAGVHGLSALTALWVGLPVVVLPPCV